MMLLLVSVIAMQAQDKMDGMINRLRAFGAKLPQEQVFLHMDNSNYFLGDTIYYKVYVRRADNGRPTNISGILYCELLNNDGYLVERQMVSLENGEGHGNFALTDTLMYAGYYELRAYTRWQLNWGVTEYPHGRWSKDYFFSKDMARDYYRDYEKLYSRVFPVYDRPQAPGEYFPDMTLRPLAENRKTPEGGQRTVIQFFPEGGSLTAGLAQHVAWEARNGLGQAMEGTLSVAMPDGTSVVSETQNRGRGVFEITAPAGRELVAVFRPKNVDGTAGSQGAETVEARLPKAAVNGVSLHVDTDTAGIHIICHAVDSAAQEPLGLTIMHNGVVAHFCRLTPDGQTLDFRPTEAGVYQTTVFNADGRVYADRLSFFLPAGFSTDNVELSCVGNGMCKAFAPVSLELHGAPGASLSLSVRDAALSEYTYDTGTMFTETLLASQIRGFVPDPQWFFLKDEPQRREGLDLLLMVQGWRRYSWREMALPGNFELRHMPESRYPHWTGQVHNYSAEQVLSVTEQKQRDFAGGFDSSDDGNEDSRDDSNDDKGGKDKGDGDADSDDARDRFNKKENRLKHPVAVHAEFSQPGSEGVSGDMRSSGTFSLDFPRYYYEFFFFLAASDTTKWKKGQPPVWTQSGRTKRDEVDFPEFYVKLDIPYPRFTKPYDYYQSHLAPIPEEAPRTGGTDADVRHLSDVVVVARGNIRRRFGRWKPAFVVDAYEAFNATCDAGFAPGYFMGASRFIRDVARTYIGDMGDNRYYQLGMRFDGKTYTENSDTDRNRRKTGIPQDMPEFVSNMSDAQLDKYNYLWNLSKVAVYTDFSPRNAILNEYDELPGVTVDLRLMEDGGERSYQKNRRWKMRGLSVPDDFYSPDYSSQPLPKADYRRTLYWNPCVRLDGNGRARVTLYKNSKAGLLQVRAEGWAQDGTPQCGHIN